MKKKLKFLLLLSLGFLVLGCSNADKFDTQKYYDEDFELEKYLGKWYEIARIDSWFEKGLTKVTAEYSLMENGKIRVINSGYDAKKEKRKVAKGKARQQYDNSKNLLEVSFFGPFYGDYIVMEYDKEYQYALVRSESSDFLWILAREPELDQSIVDDLLNKAEEEGIDVDKVIMVKQ